MFGLRSMPSGTTRWSRSSVKTACCTREVSWKLRSIVWSPSISTSGSTIGTSPASCDSAAKRASACAFVQMAYSLGIPLPIEYVARHFVKRAPSSRYSSSRSRSPSKPSVIVSSEASASGFVPLSTLIPGMIPRLSSSFGNEVPSAEVWRIVSSKRITPLMYSSTPFVVKSSSRYVRRFSSVDSTLIESKRFLIVRSLSSAARIPLPSATRAFAVSWSSVPIRLPLCSLLVIIAFRGGLQQELNTAQLGGGRRLDCPCADPPGRMDLVPAVRRVLNPGPDDLDPCAFLGDGDPRAVLGDDLHHEFAAAKRIAVREQHLG